MDILFVGITVAFFALCWLLVKLAENLRTN
jgi:hypothetical protein